MSQPVLLPPPENVLERIRCCRDELAALKKLLRLSEAVVRAEQARRRRLELARAAEVSHGR
jgi:hypothetical protein